MINDSSFVGLFAAGGQAKRLGNIQCSKEILPLPLTNNPKNVVGDYLLSAYAAADIRSVYIILRTGKWDIIECMGSGESRNIEIAYLILKDPWGTPFTLDQSWPYVKDKNIAMGFPDIILNAERPFVRLKDKLSNSHSDVVLGLFTVDNPQKFDMVQINDNGDVIQLDIKPQHTTLKFTWVIAVWRPSFTKFMHEYLQQLRPLFENDSGTTEPFVGTIINAALDNGLKVSSVIFNDGSILDIGTPDDLERANRELIIQQ